MSKLLFIILLVILCALPPLEFGRELNDPSPTEKQIAVITPTPKEVLKSEVAKQGLTERDFEILSAIIQAESQWRQFESPGVVLKGIINPKDKGLFQINEFYHLENSKKLGFDIYIVEGNIKMGIYLYKKNGTRDWNWSKENWSKNI